MVKHILPLDIVVRIFRFRGCPRATSLVPKSLLRVMPLADQGGLVETSLPGQTRPCQGLRMLPGIQELMTPVLSLGTTDMFSCERTTLEICLSTCSRPQEK